MADKIIVARELDLAWAGGYLSNGGSFTQASRAVKLGMRTTPARAGALKEFGAIVGIKVVEGNHSGKQVFVLQVSGNPLHEVMTKLWPYLSRERKQEYAKQRKRLKERLFEAGKANGDIAID